MSKVRFVGLDVHAETIAVAVAEAGGEVRSLGVFPGRPESVRKMIGKLGPVEKLKCCYEAGPTGYVLHWAGELTAVWVLDEQHETLRDLVRAREAAKQDQLRHRHQLGKFLPRHGKCPTDAGKPWSAKYLNWIKVHVRFEQRALEATLADYLHEVEHAAERIVRLEQSIEEAVAQAAPEIRAVIEALQALRGVAHITAATVVAEVGSLSRFENPRRLMGYTGMVPREHSSGNRTQRGAITKCGNAHLGRVLVEAAWACRHRPAVNGRLLKRQRLPTLSDETKRIAWKAQQRLHKRYTATMARGKHKNQVVTALARELLGFLWAIAVQTETQFKKAAA